MHELLRHFDAEVEAAFQPRSRRPHHSPHAVTAELEDQVVRIRKKRQSKGLDAMRRPSPPICPHPRVVAGNFDDHSRLAVGSTVRRTTLVADVVTSFEKAFARYGIPAKVLTDNGAIFTGEPRGHGQVALERELRHRRVIFDHSRPYHPQTCGKVERFHQTQKKWLAA